MPRERTHVALTVWPMTVLFIVGLVRGWPAIEGAPSYAASAPSTWSWLALHTFVVLLSLLAYSIGWSRFQPDELSGHPYRSVGCVRLQKMAGGVAWGLLFAHLILQWVMTLRVGPVALSHYELLRGFLSRPPVLAFYVVGLAEGTSRHWIASSGTEDPDHLAQTVADLAWAGLRGSRSA